MLFQFKSNNEDFVVKEELWFTLTWKGDVFFVNFRKNNFNTMDIVEHLCYGLKLERKELWIAGLKDKNWITDQRISIYKRVLNRIWWEEKFLEVLSQKTQILETNRHDTPLAIWKNAGNYFKIKLIAKWNITEEIQTQIENNIKKIQINWFPNCFGKQRFGKWYRNFYRAKEIFESQDLSVDDQFEIRFKLQAYASMYFNEYAIKRRHKWQTYLAGDIMTNWDHWFDIKVWIYDSGKVWLFNYEKTKAEFEEQNFIHPYYLSWETIDITKDSQWRKPTWPMIGFNMLMPPKDSKSYFRDLEVLQETEFEKKGINVAKKYNIYGFRRPLWATPKNMTYEREQNPKDKYKKDLNLSFSLPTGSYATIFLGFMFEWVDDKTILENWLEIPLIK